eukprot:768647-Hanusia_phi.AAC.10
MCVSRAIWGGKGGAGRPPPPSASREETGGWGGPRNLCQEKDMDHPYPHLGLKLRDEGGGAQLREGCDLTTTPCSPSSHPTPSTSYVACRLRPGPGPGPSRVRRRDCAWLLCFLFYHYQITGAVNSGTIGEVPNDSNCLSTRVGNESGGL